MFSTASVEDRLLGYQTGCQGQITVRFEHLSQEDLGTKIPSENNLQLTLIGAGADAPPLFELAQILGWEVQILDYRKNLIEALNQRGINAQHFPCRQIASQIPRGQKSAVVLMTHNFEADLEILASLRDIPFGYLGCVGPAARWQRLQEDLLQFHDLTLPTEGLEKVYAPAGIFKRGAGPTDIALSVLAQIQGLLIEVQPVQNHWSLILAAGASRRFGGPKILAQWQGQSFLDLALDKAKNLTGSKTLVVSGAWHEKMNPWMETENINFNPQWQEGMGSSIAFGVKKILENDSQAQSITLLTIDQPLMSEKHLLELRKASLHSGRVALTGHGDNFGPPACLPASFFSLAQNLRGEKGLKSVLHADDYLILGSSKSGIDFDQPDELQKFYRPR